MMAMSPYLAQRLMEERVKDALREAEQAQLARMVQKFARDTAFLLSAMQHLRVWQGSGNDRIWSIIDNLWRLKKDKNTWQVIK